MTTTNAAVPVSLTKVVRSPTAFANADFQTIRQDLVAQLASLTEFRDFNFDGSAMSLLVDALAYASNYMAVHANLTLTEIFMATAQLRNNVVARAKDLNYFPRQVTASRSTVRLQWTAPGNATGLSVLVPRGTAFSSSGGSGAYRFVTLQDYPMLEARDALGAVVNAGTYLADVEIHEGQFLTRTFTVPNSTEVPLYSVPDADTDPDYFDVRVTEIGNPTPFLYSRSTDIVDVTPTSLAFFLQEGVDGSVEFYFGDGVIGNRPGAGATVTVSYLVTHAEAANGCTDFDIVTSVQQGLSTIPPSDVLVSTLTKSAYGAPKQDLDGIRFTAPKNWQAQNRCVTDGDYQAIINREFGFVETISVWGGETSTPPQYGRVLVAIKPKGGTFLSPAVKQQVVNTLRKYCIVGIVPTVVDPDYTYVELVSEVSYVKENTTKTDGQLVQAIQEAISSYFEGAVTKFSSTFRFSKLVAVIDGADASLLGNTTTYRLAKKFVPTPNQPEAFSFRFGNALVPGSLSSSAIPTVGGGVLTFRDASGFVSAYLNGVLSQPNCGSVDYAKGVVSLTSFSFPVPDNTQVTLYADCAEQDVVAKQDGLIVLDTSTVTLKRFYRNDLTTGLTS